tara:strand:+ start:23 stop:1072 length:1050 start_codon:yes stop_codon:yes gene_type:complete
MKCFKLIIFILVIFNKTGNVLSEDNLFNVNNIELSKKTNTSNDDLSKEAILIGFEELKNKILLDKDLIKLSNLDFTQINELLAYYQVATIDTDNQIDEKLSYNIFFDKEKIHKLFYEKGISYSEISKKELYILPILKNKDQFFVYNNNFYYDNWNKIYENDLIEFILPLENIEIIQKINSNKDNLLNINLNDIFEEYKSENLAFVIIENINLNRNKIFLKTEIIGKKISKNLKVENDKISKDKFNENTIIEIKKEIINIVKSQNLIDVRTPSFLNAKLIINGNNNLFELNSRLKKIDLIENIFVQEFNNKFVSLKIKYLGKLEKVLKQLENQKIMLNTDGNQWSLRIVR